MFGIDSTFDHRSNIFHHTTSVLNPSHLVSFGIVEEVGPVWIRLHEPELKELPETQLENTERDLGTRGGTLGCFSRSWVLQPCSRINLYLVPGLLVQVYAVVQRGSVYQLHRQHPGARELVDHFWDSEKVITLQQGAEGKREVGGF